MTFLKKLAGIIALAVVVFFGASAAYLQTHGRQIVAEQAKRIFHRPADIGAVGFVFPLALRVDGITIEGLLSARQLIIQYDAAMFFRSHTHLARVKMLEPVMTLRRTREGRIMLGDAPHGEPVVDSRSPVSRAGKPSFMLGYLYVEAGQLDLVDERSATPGRVTIRNVQMEAWRVPLSAQSLDTKIDFSGLITEGTLPFVGCRVDANGWFNWIARNMDGTVRLTDAKNELALKLDLRAVSNDLSVKGSARVAPFETKPEESQPDSAVALVKGILSTTATNMDVNFAFQTKMDRWDIGDIVFSGDVSRGASAGAPKPVMDDLTNIGKQFEAYHENIRLRRETPRPDEP